MAIFEKEQGNYPAARKLFKRVIVVNPKLPGPWMPVGAYGEKREEFFRMQR